MTVTQEQRTAAADVDLTTAPAVPQQRRPEPAPPAQPDLHGWGSVEDRVMSRWLLAFALALGLFVSLFVALGADVWGQ